MSPHIIISTDKVVISQHVFADILEDIASGQRSLHAAVNIPAGEVICNFSASAVMNHATYLTIQTGVDTHITLAPEFLKYTNHSCEPTVFFNTATLELISLKELHAGDEFTFFYPSTEWEMAQPFVCNCGNTNCLQLVNGAAHLSIKTLSNYKLTDFIKQQVKQKLAL